MSAPQDDWDVEVDVVVLGSGGAGLVAALAAHHHGADVVIVEKSGMVGGTTAMSGGMMWIPMNHHAVEDGIEDSFDDVVAYLDALAPERLDADTLSAYLECGPEMIRFIADHTPAKLRHFKGFPDYQPWLVGALPHGGRSLDNDVFPFEELGTFATRVNPPKVGVPKILSRMEDKYGGVSAEEIEDRKRRDCRGQGQALVGGLFKAIIDRDIPVVYETRARHLISDGSRIVGVEAEQERGTVHIRARKGVVIATGGFEWNEQLVKTFLRGPMTGPISVPECEGDGLVMAMEVGASLGNMANAWWMTSSKESKAGHRDAKPNYLPCASERAYPGSILVNRRGQRFVDEAMNYNALGFALHTFDPHTYEWVNLPYWMVFDSNYMRNYRMFTSLPGDPVPSWAVGADTLEELGAKVGIDGEGLAATVERFNGFARQGHDDDFGRGDNTWDRWVGDTAKPGTAACLGEITEAPFYAIRMEAGVNGTCGGPRSNGDAQVLGLDEQPIDGLYVCSNAMASVTAGHYGGGGGTLGPGMTFGFIAGRHAALKG